MVAKITSRNINKLKSKNLIAITCTIKMASYIFDDRDSEKNQIWKEKVWILKPVL